MSKKRRHYLPQAIEPKWQAYWHKRKMFLTELPSKEKPKFYVLDMFPYPSGAGLHIGHPLGYVATDIVARYKKAMGYSVLHPMGFDAFGLPAEQYAIQTGQHPANTTEQNCARYREQLKTLGLSFDWAREVTTSTPHYYQWTQWIFLLLFDSWFDEEAGKAYPIQSLVERFERAGSKAIKASSDAKKKVFTASEWRKMSTEEQYRSLLPYRLAYLADSYVNWCPELGTVLANEEVKDGRSERGNHPVVQKKMKQWSLRTTAYAERLLDGLLNLAWPKAILETQKNWIGKSEGVTISFTLLEMPNEELVTYTTRVETIFGVSFIALATDHPLLQRLLKKREGLEAYLRKWEQAGEVTAEKGYEGFFTGLHAQHPFTGEKMPIWVANYVLTGYGTSAVMGVPAHDQRDHLFAKKYGLPINTVIQSEKAYEGAYEEKEGNLVNSDFLNGLSIPAAQEKVLTHLKKSGKGKECTTYRLRDAIFSRQRFWGEPFPIYFKEGLPYALPTSALPLRLPSITSYQPTATGEPPLARAKEWTYKGYPLELNTMPGWAASSWYFLRYMDPENKKVFADEEAIKQWGAVDLYVGGSEHATGHLLYARFFSHFLYDRGYLPIKEPFKRLVNQGMIQGISHFVYRIQGTNQFVSQGLKDQYKTSAFYVPHEIVKNKVLDRERFKRWRVDFATATFILEEGRYICGQKVEKMSKSKYNTVVPDRIVQEYGADALRLYLMFLGPLSQSKPWDTQGIEGIVRFLRKVWKIVAPTQQQLQLEEGAPDTDLRKLMAQTTHKVSKDIENCSFHTAISTLMITLNYFQDKKVKNRRAIEQFIKLLAPFAPHISEELWEELGHKESLLASPFPIYDQADLVVAKANYAIAINGKKRAVISIDKTASELEVLMQAKKLPAIADRIKGKKIRKEIFVVNRLINFVL